MATIAYESTSGSSPNPLNAAEEMMNANPEYRITAGHPSTYITRPFRNMKNLEKDVNAVLESLEEDQNSGNQWILVLGLTKSAIHKLSENDPPFECVRIRFEWEDTTGLIKVVPGGQHDITTEEFAMTVDEILLGMGIPRPDRRWAMATRHKPTAGNRGKEGDQSFHPASRQAPTGQEWGWPTLVIETGVSESLPKLREDAKWWFHNSGGQVRTVILISISMARSRVTFEKWQIMPATAQQLYAAQKVEVTQNGVDSAPMVLPFQALMDRAPGPNETDITLSAQDFWEMCVAIV